MFIALVQIHFLCLCSSVCVSRSLTADVVVVAAALMSLLLCARILNIFAYGYRDMWAIDVNHIISLGIDSHWDFLFAHFNWFTDIMFNLFDERRNCGKKYRSDAIDIFIFLSYQTLRSPTWLKRLPKTTTLSDDWNAKVLIFHFVCKIFKYRFGQADPMSGLKMCKN